MTPAPHGDTLAPLDAYVTDLVTRQAGGLRAVTIDEVIDALLDARNQLTSHLNQLDEVWRAAAAYIDPEARRS